MPRTPVVCSAFVFVLSFCFAQQPKPIEGSRRYSALERNGNPDLLMTAILLPR